MIIYHWKWGRKRTINLIYLIAFSHWVYSFEMEMAIPLQTEIPLSNYQSKIVLITFQHNIVNLTRMDRQRVHDQNLIEWKLHTCIKHYFKFTNKFVHKIEWCAHVFTLYFLPSWTPKEKHSIQPPQRIDERNIYRFKVLRKLHIKKRVRNTT